MNIEIVKRNKNPLLHREEVVLSVTSEKTPSRKELMEKASNKLGVDADKFSIEHIEQQFGTKTTKVTVRVYDSAERLVKTELPQIVGRNRGEKRKPKKKEKAPKKEK